MEGVIALLGPIRGGKDVTILLDHIAHAIDRKPSKKGLRITPDEAGVLQDFFNRRALKSTFKEKVLTLLPKHSVRLEAIQKLRNHLNKVSIPEDLFNARICSGVLALRSADRYHIYTIAQGRLLSESTFEGDLQSGLLAGGLNLRLYREIKDLGEKTDETLPLSLGDAILLNRMFCWAFFGSRHEDVRVIHMEELTRI